MLLNISVKNLAIIEDLQVRFERGLNALTGETGAGKSILVGAIGLILGNRASSEMIRSGCKSAHVEAIFDVSKVTIVKKLLEENAIDYQKELVIRRVIAKSGNSRVFLNDSAVTLGLLKKLGESLINIYGQHESQGLLKPETHLYILDDYGGLKPDRDEVSGLFADCKEASEKIVQLELKEKERISREDYLRFVIDEIEKSDIRPGEMEKLEQKRLRLKGAGELVSVGNQVISDCYESDESVYEIAQRLIRQTANVERYDPEFSKVEKLLEQIAINATELSHFCREYLSELEHDPKILETVEDRIHLIKGLINKYGSEEKGVLDFLNRAKDELDQIKNLIEELAKTKAEYNLRLELLKKSALQLRSKRKRTAKKISMEIEAELEELDMKGTTFSVRFSPLDVGGIDAGDLRIDQTGAERGEFLLAANPGEPERPLAKIASGGELSRILLAVKNALARHFWVPTLVFDEVDAGIGGRQAQIVGEKLASVADHHQVLCITHLPQIASRANDHFVVRKHVRKGRTITLVRKLSDEERIDETARMLAGISVTETARAAAAEMLDKKT